MDDIYKSAGRSMRKYIKLKNYHRFKVDMFLGIIDRQLKELNDRFDEVSTDLLVYISSFNPKDSFAAFDKENLMKLAKLYPKDFSIIELRRLSYQLGKFIIDVRGDERFRKVKNIAELSVLPVKIDKHAIHSYVYKLLRLALLLPVATTSVERAFSALNFVKKKLRNSMGMFHLLRRNFSYVLLMKISSPVSKSHLVELICNFFNESIVSKYCIDNRLRNHLYSIM
jgi:hypothetical protein